MAPTRLASKSTGVNENINSIMNQGITTRSKQMATLKTYKDNLKVTNKRKADSPLKNMTAKRAAFGDITNAFNKSTATNDKVTALKKVTVESKLLPTVKSIKPQPTIVNNKTTKSKQIQKAATNALESIQKHFTKDPPKPVATRAKNGILKNIERKSIGNENKEQNQSQNSTKSGRSDVSGEPSLYVTALENITPSDITKEEYKAISEKLNKVNLDDSLNRSLDEEREEPHRVPEGVADIDRENWNDPFQVSNYAMDIFNYLKSRERLFPIDDYLQRLKDITSWMRALLVDWMVEVQESFELNHETLYLAVKLERIPPTVDDFLYICDGAYTLAQLLKMEINILRVVDFDLGIPLSYSFLRRYARCARVSMPTLTLARFVLEQCLLEYSLVAHSDSKMAAAALYIALRIKSLGSWTPALQYYTGYTLEDIMPVVLAQNATLHKKPKSAISTVRNKYSHTTFFEVAKLPLVEDCALSTS
ncbi:G2/mitotic-specific cyclin-B3 [Papilio machaon]|uniref:G2/mitotic-specific cyclin-B3 n=1 Tax=Papilio machaon TaxID=76193 RepID=A0A194QQ62_PAPMA|nr:G2/mitotic-specific cyclin-B3 [Papilio machaon]